MLYVQSFVCLLLLLFVFSRFHHCRCRGCSISQNHSRYKTISLKNRLFNEKRATKTTTAGTHDRLKGLSLKTYIQKNTLISSWRVSTSTTFQIILSFPIWLTFFSTYKNGPIVIFNRKTYSHLKFSLSVKSETSSYFSTAITLSGLKLIFTPLQTNKRAEDDSIS